MKIVYLICALLLTNSAYSMNDDDTISIDALVKKLNTAIENKDANNVAYWNSALRTLISTDWNFFNNDQRSHYMQFHSALFDKVNPLLLNRNKTSMEEQFDKDRIENDAIVVLLIEKFKQDKCDINWTDVLGSNIETPHSPEKLKQLRIAALQKSTTPQPM